MQAWKFFPSLFFSAPQSVTIRLIMGKKTQVHRLGAIRNNLMICCAGAGVQLQGSAGADTSGDAFCDGAAVGGVAGCGGAETAAIADHSRLALAQLRH